LPLGAPDWANDRATLWNVIEQTETRINSTVAREFEIALPDELNAEQRRALALRFAQDLVARHRFVADVCIHEPSRDGDERNHHAHILCSTRRLDGGVFTEKTRELDEVKQGEVVYWRERFAQVQNRFLREAGHPERVDHRSLEDQGINRRPGVHLGPAATNYERRTGKVSNRRIELEQEVTERLLRARRSGELERQAAQLERSVIDTTADLASAQQERAQQAPVQSDTRTAAGIAQARERFAQRQREQAAQAAQAEAAKHAELARQQAAENAARALEQQRQIDAQKQAAAERKTTPDKSKSGPSKDDDKGYSR
jgi:hypothetical protein